MEMTVDRASDQRGNEAAARDDTKEIIIHD
jgi:hypothetical protein